MSKKQYQMDDVDNTLETLQDIIDGSIMAFENIARELKQHSEKLRDLRMQTKNWRHIGRVVNGLTIPEDEGE